MPTPKVPAGTYYAYDITTGGIKSGATAGAAATVQHVLRSAVLVAKHDSSTALQADLHITIEDVAAEAIILAQAPSVLTSMDTFRGMKPTKELRTRAGDVVGLYNGATLIEDYFCAGDQALFGASGDALFKDFTG